MARVVRENLRERILEAAEKRLWHFGLKKTTIDEIASDAGVGKGTVYLYFESKEEIAIALMGKYKAETVEEQDAIAQDLTLSPLARLRCVLKLPIARAHKKCADCPQALEVVVAIKPHLANRLQPHIKMETEIIAKLLDEGNAAGDFYVEDSISAAGTLKQMTLGFLPPYPCLPDLDQIEIAIDRIVNLAYTGFVAPGNRNTNELSDLRMAR